MFLLSLSLAPLPFSRDELLPRGSKFYTSRQDKGTKMISNSFCYFYYTLAGPLWHQRIRGGGRRARGRLVRSAALCPRKILFLTLPPWIRTRYEKFVGAFSPWKKAVSTRFENFFFRPLVSWNDWKTEEEERRSGFIVLYMLAIDYHRPVV